MESWAGKFQLRYGKVARNALGAALLRVLVEAAGVNTLLLGLDSKRIPCYTVCIGKEWPAGLATRQRWAQ